uniref:Uncharacterized protein n=1 Tax=Anguilla anguilla TaxID=7936 RepID=A0A0E9V0E8_ANGAN
MAQEPVLPPKIILKAIPSMFVSVLLFIKIQVLQVFLRCKWLAIKVNSISQHLSKFTSFVAHCDEHGRIVRKR